MHKVLWRAMWKCVLRLVKPVPGASFCLWKANAPHNNWQWWWETEICTMTQTHTKDTHKRHRRTLTHTLCQLEGQSVSLCVSVCDYVFLSVCQRMYDCVCPQVSGKWLVQQQHQAARRMSLNKLKHFATDTRFNDTIMTVLTTNDCRWHDIFKLSREPNWTVNPN